MLNIWRVHLRRHQSRNHHGWHRDNLEGAFRLPRSLFRRWRILEAWPPQSAMKLWVFPRQNQAACIVFELDNSVKLVYLQTTIAARLSQPSSQTGPKKPSLFTANTLPESSSSPRRLPLNKLNWMFSKYERTEQRNILVLLTALELHIVDRVGIRGLVQFCTLSLKHRAHKFFWNKNKNTTLPY